MAYPYAYYLPIIVVNAWSAKVNAGRAGEFKWVYDVIWNDQVMTWLYCVLFNSNIVVHVAYESYRLH